MMNGVASQSMREKGVAYKINWGIGLPELKIIASEYGKNYELAVELWKEDIRECKILATLIMPANEMSVDLAELWVEQLKTQEMAEMTAFNLFQHIDNAGRLALKWISSDNELKQICGYNVLARLLLKGIVFTDRDINEFKDQAQTAMSGGNISVRHAATNALAKIH